MGLRPGGLLMKLAVLFLAPLPTGYADTTYPTPEIIRIEPFDAPGARAWVMRGELGDTGPSAWGSSAGRSRPAKSR